MSEESAALWYSSADGLSLFCRRLKAFARRAPLLCLHDVGQTSRIFGPLAREMSTTRHILVPDLRGHGRSDFAIDLASYTIETLASDTDRLLDCEHIARCAVIGCGVGGLVALQLAAKQPGRVGALILCESAPDLSRAQLQAMIACAERTAGIGAWDAAERALPSASHVLRDHNGPPVCDWDPLAAQRLVASASETKAWALFDAMPAKPILALRGTRSCVITPASLEAMARRRPDIVRRTISADHDLRAMNEPAAIEAVRSFLATCP